MLLNEFFDKWDLHAKRIGEVTSGTQMRVYEDDALVADIPAKSLTDEAPVYHRESQKHHCVIDVY